MTGPAANTSDPDRVLVVVTGLGESTSLGGDVASTWAAMLRGDNGIRLLDDEPTPDGLPHFLGGRARVEPGPGLPRLQRRRFSRSTQFAVTAAAQAWSDAGLDDATIPAERVGVAVSTSMGDMTVIIDSWEVLKSRGRNRILPMALPMSMGNGPAAAVSLLVNARAGVHATVNACSSGAQALATAADMIRRGLADVVVAGGAEAPLHPLPLSGFAAMRALSQLSDEPGAACRPFDAERDGMVLGEGAGILVLESERHARERGARIYAELAGVGISSDAFHTVQPDPAGAGYAQAVRASLRDAGVSPGDVAHLNANGTSTVPGDASEARAVRAVFGDAGNGPAVSANKSMIGHTLGAAGGIEAITTVLSIHHGMVPPTRNFTRPDEGLAIDLVHGAPRKLAGSEIIAMKCAAGFGGHNVALTFRGVPERVED